jgi:hypothetical protein
MAAPNATEPDFIRLFEEIGPAELARRLGISESNVFKRRRVLERKHGRPIIGPAEERNRSIPVAATPHRIELDVEDGVVIVASDFHYWPGEPSTAHRALVQFIKVFSPAAVIANGDVIDAASVSRHPPIGWERQPGLVEEIEVAQARLKEIEDAAGAAEKIWTLGNHDSRFETRLATVAPEYAKIHGVHLKDHFPRWDAAWSVWINETTVIKHRFKGGIHAPHNNAMWSGKNIVTGHLHSAKVSPLTDYNGTRYGVDTGCIADPYGPQFTDYTEDSPRNWVSGFAVLTYKGGRLLMPELVTVFEPGVVQFRGALHHV